jgi:hypothetical protein
MLSAPITRSSGKRRTGGIGQSVPLGPDLCARAAVRRARRATSAWKRTASFSCSASLRADAIFSDRAESAATDMVRSVGGRTTEGLGAKALDNTVPFLGTLHRYDAGLCRQPCTAIYGAPSGVRKARFPGRDFQAGPTLPAPPSLACLLPVEGGGPWLVRLG